MNKLPACTIIAVALTLLGIAGCDDLCAPEATVTCPCLNGVSGAQTCDASGQHWRPCECEIVVDDGSTKYIVGGEVTRSFAATGALVAYKQQVFCTATLVAPSVVLTAAHCVDKSAASSLSFALGSEPLRPAVSAQVTSIHLHPQWAGFQDGYQASFYAGKDLAVLHLEQPVDNVLPASIFVGDAPGLLQAQMTLVGYGSSASDGVNTSGLGIRRIARVTVSEIFAESLRYSFGGQGSCNGDSGGPAFAMVGGQWQQVGVTSWGDKTCAREGHYQRLDTHQDWLASVGVPLQVRAPNCGTDGVCDGLCEDDEDCWDLLCPSGSCTAPEGQCAPDGTCDEYCGSIDPDCVSNDNDPPADPCVVYGLHANGVCDQQCPGDPDCAAPPPTQSCQPAATGIDPLDGMCAYVSSTGEVCGKEPLVGLAFDPATYTCVYLDRLGTACGWSPATVVPDPFSGTCGYVDPTGALCAVGYPWWDGFQWRC